MRLLLCFWIQGSEGKNILEAKQLNPRGEQKYVLVIHAFLNNKWLLMHDMSFLF